MNDTYIETYLDISFTFLFLAVKRETVLLDSWQGTGPSAVGTIV